MGNREIGGGKSTSGLPMESCRALPSFERIGTTPRGLDPRRPPFFLPLQTPSETRFFTGKTEILLDANIIEISKRFGDFRRKIASEKNLRAVNPPNLS